MRALLLEDNQLRGRALQRQLKAAGYTVTWVRDYDGAIDALLFAKPGSEFPDAERFDFATLDYDLETSKTGLDVARYIVGLPPSMRPLRIEVHSANDEGAAGIVAALTAAGVPVVRKELA